MAATVTFAIAPAALSEEERRLGADAVIRSFQDVQAAEQHLHAVEDQVRGRIREFEAARQARALAILAERQQTYCTMCDKIVPLGTTRLLYTAGEAWGGSCHATSLRGHQALHACCPECFENARDRSYGSKGKGPWFRAVRVEERRNVMGPFHGAALPQHTVDHRPGIHPVPERILSSIGLAHTFQLERSWRHNKALLLDGERCGVNITP